MTLHEDINYIRCIPQSHDKHHIQHVPRNFVGHLLLIQVYASRHLQRYKMLCWHVLNDVQQFANGYVGFCWFTGLMEDVSIQRSPRECIALKQDSTSRSIIYLLSLQTLWLLWSPLLASSNILYSKTNHRSTSDPYNWWVVMTEAIATNYNVVLIVSSIFQHLRLFQKRGFTLSRAICRDNALRICK